MLNREWDFRSLLWYLCAACRVVVVVSADSDQVLVLARALVGTLLLLRQAGIIQNKIDIWPWTLIIFGALITVGAIDRLRRLE